MAAHRTRNRGPGALAGVVIVVATAGIACPSEGPSRVPDSARPTTRRQVGARVQWPEPLVPETTRDGPRAFMTILFPDRTIATLSYPARLRLAERGIQITASYSFRRPRADSPHDILFIPRGVPEGFLDPEPLQRFETIPAGDATLHRVIYDRLRGDPDYALLFEAPRWDIVAVVPSRETAHVVARHLHWSVNKDGWPSMFAGGPLEMSEGFGEARGPHVEIGDRNPVFEIVDGDPAFRYITMAPIRRCMPRHSELAPDGTYAAKCLAFPGVSNGIFMSIKGPKAFVEEVFRSVDLAHGEDAR